MPFEQKVAIVTGGAWGIGAETARKLASEGANVLIADKDYEAAKENAQQIENNGGSAQAIHIDLSVSEQIKIMIDKKPTKKIFIQIGIISFHNEIPIDRTITK